MDSIVVVLVTINYVFNWLAMFHYGLNWGSKIPRYAIRGLIFYFIALSALFVEYSITPLPTFESLSSVEAVVIMIVIAVGFMSSSLGVGYIVGKRMRNKIVDKSTI